MLNNKKKLSGILSVISSFCIVLIIIPFALSTKAASNDNGQSEYIKYQTNISGSAYNIQVKNNGKWIDSTLWDEGYEAQIKVDNKNYKLEKMQNGISKNICSGIYVTLNISLVNDGKYANIEYVVKNTSSSAKIVSIGVGTNIQFGDSEITSITKLSDKSGFKMVDDNTGLIQLNFVGKNACGVTDVDSFWFGSSGYYNDNLYSQVVGNSYLGESGIAYSWEKRNILANSTQSYSVLIGVGQLNSAPSLTISNPSETFETLSLGETYTFSGIALDADNTSGTKIYYSIDEKEPVLAYTFEASPGDFTASVNIPSNLCIGAHSIEFYAQDLSGAVSEVQTRTFTVPKPTYCVSFNTNGGSEIESIINLSDGQKLAQPTASTKSGYVFAGWFKDLKLTDEWDFEKDTVISNTTLYANWEKITSAIIETPIQIKNPEMISIIVDEDTFGKSIDITIKYDTTVEEMINAILKDNYKDTLIFPLDISVYEKGTDTKVQPNAGKSVKFTLPIPEDLLDQKDKIKVAHLVDGEIEILDSKVVLIDDVYCIQFFAIHFSPYAMIAEKEKISIEKTVIEIEEPIVPKAEIALKNNETESAPNTSDNTNLISSSVFAIFSVATVIGINKKRKQD
ncbi:MAG: hypothetical protein EOM05_05390 [Clostridia bacterium]|nr:hypothetical protein [Clostridia bacterium]